jgi:hypothetical protein
MDSFDAVGEVTTQVFAWSSAWPAMFELVICDRVEQLAG